MPFARARKRSQNSESATLKVCVSVCTAACRSFPLEHAYTRDVTHTRYESKEPALYVIIWRPLQNLWTFCEKTALLNSIFNIQPLYCWIINFSHLSKVWQFLLTPVKKMFKSCCKQIYNKKQKFSPVRTSLAHQIRYNKTLVAIFPTCNVWFLHLP